MEKETKTSYQLTDLQYTELVRAATQTREAEIVFKEAKRNQDTIMSLVIDAHGGDLRAMYRLVPLEQKLVLVDD